MLKKISKICCIGAGYVGGPTMAVIAQKCPDIEINVVDINPDKIKQWNSEDLSNLPIYEPGLDEIIKKCRGINLHFSVDIPKHIAEADIIFISVNTPTKQKGIGAGQASDLKWIEASARQIAEYAEGETIVVEKSTLPVKTAQTIKEILDSASKLSKASFSILSNPEFLSEGTAINDLRNPDRVLIGGEDLSAINILINIYSKWVCREKILTTDLWSSELSKLIANAFLAQRISSTNSISALCEKTGANIKEVSLAIGMDKRIGEHFLNAGPGFGGSCFKKDISNLIYICEYYGLKEVSMFWQKVLDINIWQSKRITKLIVNKLFGTLSGKYISILGFSFKANTNDTRESPAIKICNDLLEEGAILKIYDPKVKKTQISENINSSNWIYVKNIRESIENANAVVIMTEWDEFRNIDWSSFFHLMKKPPWIFDTRSITNIEVARECGFNIWVVGNGKYQ